MSMTKKHEKWNKILTKRESKIPIFQFIHYTFYEYLVASQLFEELKVNL